MKYLIPATFVGFALMAAIPMRAAEPSKEPLVEQVRKAIEDGKKYLRENQRDGGDWEPDIQFDKISPHGTTALAMLALLVAGEKPDSPTVQRGLEFLRNKVKPTHVYTVALQTMVFAEAGSPKDLLAVQNNVDWLINAAIRQGGKIAGWSYTSDGGRPDNSNTQYALLGLYAGKQAGAKIKREVWEQIQAYYQNSQTKDGGWYYVQGQREPTPTMTTAGLCGLVMAGMEADGGRKLAADGSDPQCGDYPANEHLAKAMAWLTGRFNIIKSTGYVYYNLYGLERAGRLSGQRFFGDHDWYREGCEYLTDRNSPIRQHNDGSFFVHNSLYDRSAIASTSLALLFLAKGRTPVLVSKLVHGNPSSQATPWNNKRNDCRHLVEYASKEMFNKQPLGWQIFNARQSQASMEELTGELLQSPIAYFNGHGAIILTGREEKTLKLYVEQGGFLFVEACCGDRDFDRQFRALMTKLFDDKDHPLKPLPADHPIWTAWGGAVSPANFPLEGMEFGCRTAIVYCPKPISGYWEINDLQSAKGKEAFLLGGKIIAYATGMELPKPKLTKVEVPRDTGETKVPRGYFKVAQLKHSNDRHSTNGVMRNLMTYLRNSARVDVSLQTEEMQPTSKDLLNYKFIYMHGRGNFEIDNFDLLRANLQTGGLLFADACCGKKPFDDSFRDFVKKLFPKQDLEAIPADDELFGKDLNGSAIATVRCRREKGETGYKDAAPALEGIKVDGRWVVIYSKYDIGCALEKHQSSDCLGYDHASAALRLASAVVMYALQR